MNEYTASNGVTVYQHASEGGARMSVRDDDPRQTPGYVKPQMVQTFLDPRQVDGLREFFQAETDERLERWRWPENPAHVAYTSEEAVLVVDESHPGRAPDRITRRYCEDPVGSLGWGEGAARAYFAAHPEPKPDWQSAEPGEHWSLTVEAEERAYVAVLTNRGRDGSNVVMFYPIRDPISPAVGRLAEVITAGTRIYPPADPS